MSADTGVSWYVGVPRSGKSTLACAHLWQACARTRRPGIVIDPEYVAQFDQVRHARNVGEVLEAAWGAREHVAYAPSSRDDLVPILRACRDPGRVNLLVDEAHVFMGARSATTDPLLRLMRSHRHARLCLFLTTQHLSADIPQAAISCAPTIHLFRCTGPATLERIERDWGVPSEKVRTLEQFQYLRFSEGFSS